MRKSILILVLLFWYLNYTLPFVMDDALYAHIYPETPILDTPHALDIDNEINSFKDVLTSQWNHYFTKNGRGLVHLVVQTFCGLLGKNIYNICSAIMFGLFIFLLSKITRHRAILTAGLFFLLIPEPTCLYNGISYGVNYLWSSVYILLFVFLFHNNYNEKRSIVSLLSLCLLGFVAGWSHEGLAIPVSMAFIVEFFIRLKNEIKKPNLQITPFIYQYLPVLIFGIGVALMVFCPANFKRAAGMNESDWAGGALALRLRSFCFLRATYIFIALIIIGWLKCRKMTTAYIKENVYWLVAWTTALVFVLAIGALNVRSVFGIDFFAFILLMRFVKCINLSEKCHRVLSTSCRGIFLVCVICVLYFQTLAGRQYDEINEQLKNSKYDSALVVVSPVNPGWGLQRYVCQYKFREPWEDWEERVLTWVNKKEKVVIEQSSGKRKVAGENPFYFIGSDLFTTESLPEEVSMTWHLGKYNIYDPKSLFRSLYGYFRSGPSEMYLKMPVEHLTLNGQEFWRIKMYPLQSRKICKIDVEK